MESPEEADNNGGCVWGAVALFFLVIGATVSLALIQPWKDSFGAWVITLLMAPIFALGLTTLFALVLALVFVLAWMGDHIKRRPR